MEQSPRSSNSNSDAPSSVLGHQRHNGFERPFSRDQVVSWLGHSLSALSFYVAAVSVFLSTDEGSNNTVTAMTIAAVAVHVVNSTILVASWRSCESIDPAAPVEDSLPNGWCGVRLDGPRWEKTRYCALCRKAVPGLDHHCTWLQTCIGKANYAQFFAVACTGTLQFVLQVAYAELSLWWLQSHPLGALRYVVEGCLVACLVISVPCMFMYFVLLGFHLWLMVLGYGTYEWMLRRRKEQRAKVEAKKKKKEKAGDADESSSTSTRESVAIESSSHTVVKVDDVHPEERDRELTVL